MHTPRCEGHSVHREYGESKCRDRQSALKVTYVVESYSGKVITALGLRVCVCVCFCMWACLCVRLANTIMQPFSSNIQEWSETIKGLTEVLTVDCNEPGVMKPALSTKLSVTFNTRGREWMWFFLNVKWCNHKYVLKCMWDKRDIDTSTEEKLKSSQLNESHYWT